MLRGRGRGEHIRDLLQAEVSTDCGKDEAWTNGLVNYTGSHIPRDSLDVRFILKTREDLDLRRAVTAGSGREPLLLQGPERVITAARCVPAPRHRGLCLSFF